MKAFIGTLIIAIVIIVTAILWYKNIKPSVTADDILVESTLEPNTSDINGDKEYLLRIKMTRNEGSNIAIYPYIEGLSHMSFSKRDEGYFIPGAIGSDGSTEAAAINELKSKNLFHNVEEVSLAGFYFPEKAGKYESKIYLDKLKGASDIENPALVCVYTEKKFGKKLTWTKILPITIK